MKKTIKIILILLVVGAVVYVFRGTLKNQIQNIPINLEILDLRVFPCQKPIAYGIGAFDARFGISKEDFLKAVSSAAEIWGKPISKELFQYQENGGLKINLIYDYRQDATARLRKLGLVVNDDKATYNTLKAEYLASQVSYKQDKMALDAKVATFEDGQNKYNAEVERWNREGGAPEEIYNHLNQDKTALNEEFLKIKNLEAGVNAEIENLNALVVTLNRLAEVLNINVARYNEIGKTTGEEFEEGNYQSDAGGQKIDIYQFDSRAKLIRVLAHELGHALGIEHLENPKAIMYRLNQGKNIALTQDDISALKKLCEIK